MALINPLKAEQIPLIPLDPHPPSQPSNGDTHPQAKPAAQLNRDSATPSDETPPLAPTTNGQKEAKSNPLTSQSGK